MSGKQYALAMGMREDYLGQGLVKICFRTGEMVETLWAQPVGSDMFRLDNCPFYAYGVSWKDVVEARKINDSIAYDFIRVIEPSGHRMIRLTVGENQESVSTQLLNALVAMGCTYEGANPQYLSVDIPPNIDFDSVIQVVTNSDAVWEYANPSYQQVMAANRKKRR